MFRAIGREEPFNGTEVTPGSLIRKIRLLLYLLNSSWNLKSSMIDSLLSFPFARIWTKLIGSKEQIWEISRKFFVGAGTTFQSCFSRRVPAISPLYGTDDGFLDLYIFTTVPYRTEVLKSVPHQEDRTKEKETF